MLVETNNLVSAAEFRKDLDKYVAAARQGSGPIAVTRNAEVLGFFIGAEEYEAVFGGAVKNLLEERATGPTLTHADARQRVRKALQAKARKP
jgi:prevent-host-death family protein